jgi:hypothetical protein
LRHVVEKDDIVIPCTDVLKHLAFILQEILGIINIVAFEDAEERFTVELFPVMHDKEINLVRIPERSFARGSLRVNAKQ